MIEQPASRFAHLKAGDLVILDSSRYGSESLSVERIYKVTETQIVLRWLRGGSAPHDVRFDRATGREKGVDSRYYFPVRQLHVPTPELLDRAEKRRLESYLKTVEWKQLPLDTLRAVEYALRNPVPPLKLSQS